MSSPGSPTSSVPSTPRASAPTATAPGLVVQGQRVASTASLYMSCLGQRNVTHLSASSEMSSKVYKLRETIKSALPDYEKSLSINFTHRIVSYTNKNGEKIELLMGEEEVSSQSQAIQDASKELSELSREIHKVFNAVYPRDAKTVVNRDGKGASLNPEQKALKSELKGSSCARFFKKQWKGIQDFWKAKIQGGAVPVSVNRPLEELKRNLADKEKELAEAKEAERQHKTTTLDPLKAQIDQEEKELEALIEKSKAPQSELARKDQRIKNLETRLQEMEVRHGAIYRERADRLRERSERIADEKRMLQTEMDQYAARASDRKDHIADLQSQIDQCHIDIEKVEQRGRDEVAPLIQTRTNLERERSEYTAKPSSSQIEREKAVRDFDTRIGDVNRQINAIEERVAKERVDLNARITLCDYRISLAKDRWKEEEGKYHGRLVDIHREELTLFLSEETLERQKVVADRMEESLSTKIQQLKKERETLASQGSSDEARIIALDASLQRLSDKLDEETNISEEFGKKVEDSSKEVGVLNNRVQQFERNLFLTAQRRVESLETLRGDWIQKVDKLIQEKTKTSSDKKKDLELIKLLRFKKQLQGVNMDVVRIAVTFGVLHGLDQEGATLESRQKCALDIQEYMKDHLKKELEPSIIRGVLDALPFGSRRTVKEEDVELLSLESGDLVFAKRSDVDQRVVQNRLDHPEMKERKFKESSVEELLVGMILFDRTKGLMNETQLQEQLILRGWDFREDVRKELFHRANG